MISCKLELVKIGVVGDAQKRLRELQVGSAAVGVTTRTLGNWKAAPAFHRERERQHKRVARQRAAPPSSKAKPPARQAAQNKPSSVSSFRQSATSSALRLEQSELLLSG